MAIERAQRLAFRERLRLFNHVPGNTSERCRIRSETFPYAVEVDGPPNLLSYDIEQEQARIHEVFGPWLLENVGPHGYDLFTRELRVGAWDWLISKQYSRPTRVCFYFLDPHDAIAFRIRWG